MKSESSVLDFNIWESWLVRGIADQLLVQLDILC
jgi:hypothetical protein